jgi:hypothetical protein
VSDEYNPIELAHEKRMRGKFSPIDAFEIARNTQDWYCPRCQAFVSAEAVTYEETHVVCGTTVTSDDTVITLAQENARFTAELTALKARRCDTCGAWRRYVASEDVNGFCCVHHLVGLPPEAFCSYWRGKDIAHD